MGAYNPANNDAMALGSGYAPTLAGSPGEYWSPRCSRTTGTSSVDVAFFCPVYVPRDTRLDRIGAEVTVGALGSTINLCIYDDDPEILRPNNLLLNAGAIDGNAVAPQELVIDIELPGGFVYYFMLQAVGGVPTIRRVNVSDWWGRHTTLANATSSGVAALGFSRAGVAVPPDPAGSVVLAGVYPIIAVRFA